VKVYKDEGEDEKRSSENLSEDKLGLVTETEEVGMVVVVIRGIYVIVWFMILILKS